jgi:prepilin-type N-terminal cleavage/methylation domain-containing protein/prepilin-type processing-associated H-X9-DG protein
MVGVSPESDSVLSSVNPPRRMRASLRHRAAFTLIELLVVIGIIAILISIILPSVISVRRQANIVTCASNLRTITQASLLHAHDHHGFLPLAGTLNIDQPTSWNASILAAGLGDGDRKRYTYALAGGVNVITPLPASLAPYLTTIKLNYNDWYALDTQLNDNRGVWQMFMCPSTDAMEKHHSGVDASTPVGQGTMMVISINGSANYLWSTNSDFAINEGVFGFDSRPAYQARRLGGNLTRIKRPSELMLYCDANPASSIDPSFIAMFQYPWLTFTPAPLTTPGDTPPVTLADALARDSNVLTSRAEFDRVRHKNRMNVVFADAHVELVQISAGDLQHVLLSVR